MCGASLAHHGLLGSIVSIMLHNVDLSPVPAQHLASLASCVTNLLTIQNICGCDLVSLLTSLKCEVLNIWSQNLGKEETRALVQAMESSVEEVVLSHEVTLDWRLWLSTVARVFAVRWQIQIQRPDTEKTC